MSSVVLTTSGASFMAQAGTMFPAMPIRYALFQYDARLDPYVLPTSGLTPILSADTTSAVGIPSPTFCETIYNIDTLSLSAYSISNNEFLIFDPNQLGSSTITGNRFNDTVNITLLNGRPLSNVVSGTSIVYNYPNWTVNGYTLVTGSNSVPSGYSSSRDKYFRVNSFAPISSAAGGQAAGLFKVLIDNTKGNFKFNKILLFATRILSGGVDDTSIEPVLVGMAYLNSPVIKSNDGTNLNFFEADIEVQFSANNYFGNVSYLNNNNWNYVGGEQMVWFDGKVAIGTSAIPGSWLARAKLQITENNPVIPNIRLTDDNLYSYIDTYYSHSTVENLLTIQGSKANVIYVIDTSGSSKHSKHELRLDSDIALRQWRMTYTDPVSGLVSTGWESTYGGYLETSNFKFDGNFLATFRSARLGQYGTLVLGQDSDLSFEHRSKFLTVHGGSLFVGSSLVSGSLSGNGPMLCDSLSVRNNITSQVGVIHAGGGITYDVGLQANPNTFAYVYNLRVTTSAAFNCPVFVNGYNLSANAYIIAPNLYARDHIFNDGSLNVSGVSYLNNLNVSGASNFVGDANFTNSVSIPNFLSVGSLDATTLTLQTLVVAGNSSFIGTSNFYSSVISYASLNVSGALNTNNILNVANGDLNLKTVGKGILINRTTGYATAGVTSVGGATSPTINTIAVKSSPKSTILLSYENQVLGGNNLDPIYVSSIVDGVSFTVRQQNGAVFPSNTYIHWFIINEAV